MKIKQDFITNSSTTSYVVFGYEIPTGKEYGSSEDEYYDDAKLEKQIAKMLKLPKEFEVFDTHGGEALVGIVLTGYGCIRPVPISEVLDKLDKLREIAKKNEWSGEPKIFSGERSSE